MPQRVVLLDGPATDHQIHALRRQCPNEVRLAIDIELEIIAAGGEYHKDCEDVLLAAGSAQDHIWGATWFRTTKTVEFISVINIRPRFSKWTMEIQDRILRSRIERIVRKCMEAV